MSFTHVVFGVIQALLILLLSPLLNGVIKKIKALFQCRKGPGIFQPYYDLAKYMKKDAVISNQASWLTIITPYLTFAGVLTAGLLVPMFTKTIGFVGDFILFAYLLAIYRFLMALTALDAGSSFGGMGASREMALNSMVEPALFLSVVAVILQTGTTNLSYSVAVLHEQGWNVLTISYVLAFVAMFLVVIAETGRIPVDNPDTHLELTMIHEGMLLEYSGRYLGLMVWSSMMKQFIILSLFAGLFFPFGWGDSFDLKEILTGMILFLVKVFGLGIVLAVVEASYAKIRLFHVPKLFVTSMALSLLAIIVNVLF